MKKNPLYSWIILAVSLFFGIVVFLNISIPFILFEQRAEGALQASGPVTKEKPFEYCLNPLPYNPSSFEIFLATYKRKNTSHYLLNIFTLQQGQKNLITQKQIDASEVEDNSFYEVQLPSSNRPLNGDREILCFALQSDDATSQNALTIILNSQQEPLIKVKAIDTVKNLLGRIWLKELGYSFFFLYILAQIVFAFYLIRDDE